MELNRRSFGEVIKAVEEIKGEAWAEFRERHGDWVRDLALWLGRQHCGLLLRELGELAGGLDYAAVSVALARWRRRMAEDRTIAKRAARAAALLEDKEQAL